MNALHNPGNEHRKRLRKIQVEALGAIIGICASSLSIYWTFTHGLPFKTLWGDEIERAIVIFTALIYILAQCFALSTCFFQWKLSGRQLKLDELSLLPQQDKDCNRS